MKRLVSIFLVFFYILAQVFLPKGNFSYIEQIPVLYADFCKTNGTNDIFEFFEEQFFEFEFAENDADEPFEKETKSVPFHAPCVQTFVAFYETKSLEFLNLEETNSHNFIYILKEHWTDAPSIYHPPKNKLV
ncbi:MAG: hypothetical protein ACYDCN_02635 [Bacteroidia bacterium]